MKKSAGIPSAPVEGIEAAAARRDYIWESTRLAASFNCSFSLRAAGLHSLDAQWN